MPLRRAENVKNNRRLLRLSTLVVGLSLLWLPAMPVAATNSSDIGVIVCGGAVPAAQIDITEPLSDSVITQADTTFRGTVANATQIDISVDGNYSQTVAVGTSDSSFETDLTLTEGTHTITATANGICGSAPALDSVVVTYQPEAETSGGSSTPTTVTDDGNGVVVGDGLTLSDDHTATPLDRIPIVGPVVNAVTNFAQAVGLENTVNTTNVVVGVSRVGITVAALTSVVMASSLAPVAAQRLPGLSQVFNTTSHRSMLYLGWAIRGIGVLAMALVYFV